MRAWWMLAVLLPLLSGCDADTGAPRKPVAAVREAAASVRDLTIADQPAMVAEPRLSSRRAVLYLHGSGATGNSIVADPRRAGLAVALLRTGYALAGSDAYGEAWGSPRSVGAYLALAAEVRRRGYSRLYVLAESMGGLAGLRMLDRLRPAAWAGLAPVCNLRSVRDKFGTLIDAAYGGHEPGAGLVQARAVKRLPMLFRASPDDHTVPMAQNTERCARSERRRGALVTIEQHSGDHGDPSVFAPAGLLAFFAAH